MEYRLYTKNDKLYFQLNQGDEIKLDILAENRKMYEPYVRDVEIDEEYNILGEEYIHVLEGDLELDKNKIIKIDKVKAKVKSKFLAVEISNG